VPPDSVLNPAGIIRRRVRSLIKKRIVFLVIILAIIITAVIIFLLNPLRRSEERIRADMLELTPIGTSVEELIRVIEGNRNWEIRQTRDIGYSMMHGFPEMPRWNHITREYLIRNDTIVGVTSMEVIIGDYNWLPFLFRRSVTIFYGFDEDSNLVDIAIRKYSWDKL
jgi:hypothetical protein